MHVSRVALLFWCGQIPLAWSLSNFRCLLSHLSFIPFTWAISAKGCRGLFLPVIHHSTWMYECVSVWLFPLSSIAKSHPLNFHRLCARWHFPSPLHFKVAGEPFSGHWESPLLPLSAGALFTLNYTSARARSQTYTVFLLTFVCVNGFYGCVALYLWRRILLSSVSARLLFFPCIIVFLPQVLLFVCRVLYSSCDAFKSHGTHKKH